MLEVPLNLRWDFNTSDNSLFFFGVGTSSYLFTRQNCIYYYNFYNPRTLDSKRNHLLEPAQRPLRIPQLLGRRRVRHQQQPLRPFWRLC